jgi:hypothetical protein
MRIPITMCHGIEEALTVEHFTTLMQIAHDMGFHSISYDDLDSWRNSSGALPPRPIMIDFDHPVRSIHSDILGILTGFGFSGNLFINTGGMGAPRAEPPSSKPGPECMTWDEVGELMEAGWLIGAHTVSHPNLSDLSVEDPSGQRVRAELEQCDETLEKRLGVRPRDFAYTATTWSSAAEREVMARYRFGRLWIIGAQYEANGKPIRFAELAGVPGPDEADGGPPHAARYITKETHAYRLPSMELTALIHDPEAFRRYLEGALSS